MRFSWLRRLRWWRWRSERLLAVQLLLIDKFEAQDEAILDALGTADLSWFTHVMLHVPSHRDLPVAVAHERVKRAVAHIRRKRLKLIWGRWLWTAWGKGKDDDHVSFPFYANSIDIVKNEARFLRADGTMLDVEPYGVSPQRQSIQPIVHDPAWENVDEAVKDAVAHAGQVDYVFPPSAPDARGYQWLLRGLGRALCEHRTYYSHPPELRVPRVVPPIGQRHLIHRWGCYVHPTGAPVDPKRPDVDVRLTPAEVKSIGMRAIRRNHPECRGVWVYADAVDLPEVMRGWARQEALKEK